MRRIAVLMGGDSQERKVSHVTGAAVAKALAKRGHQVTLLDTHQGPLPLPEGDLPAIGSRPPELESGVPALASSGPGTLARFTGSLEGVDVVFIALHGGWGEDGTIQAFFDLLGIPYTGSGVLGSSLAMNKDRAKRVFRSSGIETPDWALLVLRDGLSPTDEDLDEILDSLGTDLIVKPNAEGSTVGLTRVSDRAGLRTAIETANRYGDEVLVETFIPGRELTVAVLGDEAFPVVEIVPEGGLYTYEAKYTKGKSRYVAPARLDQATTETVQEAALAAFEVLGCEGFARVDFRLDPDGDLYCLEVNTVPGMTELSLVPMAAKAAGVSFEELLDRIVDDAVERGPRRRRGSSPLGVES